MPTIQYFCTENYIKSNTTLTANVDFIAVLPLVKNSSEFHVRFQLGTLFYNDLLTKYNAQSLSANETLLVEMIQPAVAWFACAATVISDSYQLKNKGVQTQSGDFSAAVEMKAIMLLNAEYTKYAEFYLNAMKQWLITNKNLFSVFIDPANKNDSDIHLALMDKGKTPFTNGIFLW